MLLEDARDDRLGAGQCLSCQEVKVLEVPIRRVLLPEAREAGRFHVVCVAHGSDGGLHEKNLLALGAMVELLEEGQEG